MAKTDINDWDEYYRSNRVTMMPWYNPALDHDLANALQEMNLASGRFLDLGTGPGTQAGKLAAMGFEVTATDIAPEAVRQATAHASGVRFVVDNIVETQLKEVFDFVFDRGCFHTLKAEQRENYVRNVRALLTGHKLLFLKCFSEEEPGDQGPHRISPSMINELFEQLFFIDVIIRTVFKGNRKPNPKALFCVLRGR